MVIALATLNKSNHHRLSSSEERTAHNREVTGSTPVGGIYPSGGLSEHATAVSTATLTTGMAQRLARGAHNSEVTRSKRVAGIYHLGGFIRTRHRCLYSNNSPGWRSGERAGLITPRSLVRIQFPVFILRAVYQNSPPLSTQQHYSPAWRSG